MIGVSEAKNIIQSKVQALQPIQVELALASGTVLASDIFAPQDIPAFSQSSMDGYAFRFADWVAGNGLPLMGEMAAGSRQEFLLHPGAASRIFTGAPLPGGADTVIMQEKTKLEDQKVYFQEPAIVPGMHVRNIGAEIKKGALALGQGTLLTAAAIGFLAGIGINSVQVYPHPRIAILITGNELQTPGVALQFGQVYDSNSLMLKTALQQAGINQIELIRVMDEEEATIRALDSAFQKNDLVLLTGGVSVGDYDFVARAAAACAVNTCFHRINQRPGKPLYFGMRNCQPVFGLPGNPSSVLTCFYEYVLPAISKLTHRNCALPVLKIELAHAYSKTISLTLFLKALYSRDKVTILPAQESYKLSSFATANCLLQLPDGIREYEAGEMVEVHVLPV
jgi:molybdopterin molybdotransferase